METPSNLTTSSAVRAAAVAEGFVDMETEIGDLGTKGAGASDSAS
jgi:hypothetical protein